MQQKKHMVTEQLLMPLNKPTFLTLRMDLTWAVLEAWGPPVWMDWDISSEYILQNQTARCIAQHSNTLGSKMQHRNTQHSRLCQVSQFSS